MQLLSVRNERCLHLRYLIANPEVNPDYLIWASGYKVERLAHLYLCVYFIRNPLCKENGDVFSIWLCAGIFSSIAVRVRGLDVICKNVSLNAGAAVWAYPALLRQEIILYG